MALKPQPDELRGADQCVDLLSQRHTYAMMKSSATRLDRFTPIKVRVPPPPIDHAHQRPDLGRPRRLHVRDSQRHELLPFYPLDGGVC